MPLSTACTHTDRPMKARGLCKSCWSKEQRSGWKRPAAIADTPIPGGLSGKPGKVAKPAPAPVLRQPTQDPYGIMAAALPDDTAPPYDGVEVDGVEVARVQRIDLVGDGVAALPTPEDLAPVGTAYCIDCGEYVTKSNLSRHRKRRHAA